MSEDAATKDQKPEISWRQWATTGLAIVALWAVVIGFVVLVEMATSNGSSKRIHGDFVTVCVTQSEDSAPPKDCHFNDGMFYDYNKQYWVELPHDFRFPNGSKGATGRDLNAWKNSGLEYDEFRASR